MGLNLFSLKVSKNLHKQTLVWSFDMFTFIYSYSLLLYMKSCRRAATAMLGNAPNNFFGTISNI